MKTCIQRMIVAVACLAGAGAYAGLIYPITIDGDFTDWAEVPSHSDPVDDTHDTNHSLETDVPDYVNHPDVDLIEFKCTHDADNLYAYFRATGEIGRTQTLAEGKAGRYYVIVTIDVDNDDATGYWLHEGGYFPTTPGYDMNMEVEYYDGTFNTGHYLNHGCLDAAEFAAAQADQANGVVDLQPGTYDWYTQWVWWDTPQGNTGEIVLPDGHSTIIWVVDKGPVYQGILTIALSPDGHEAEMMAPFRGFMKDKNAPTESIAGLGKTMDFSFSLEASGELAPDLRWASDTAEPIEDYYLSVLTAAGDEDGDGLTNAEEEALGTDPEDDDSDHDGLPDAWEDTYGLDPLSDVGDDGAYGDPDGDSVRNIDEYNAGTDPSSSDSYPMPAGGIGAALAAAALVTFLARRRLRRA